MEEKEISMEVVNPHAAGIDIGSRSHWVGIGQREQDIREFGVFNQDLFEMADWFKENHIKTIAMESTGIYWKPVFNILEGSGLTILIVNARHIKYVPGHKTDKKDSAWIAKLLLAGLLKGSFVPPVEIRQLRDMTRYRRKLEGAITAEKNRMIKMLEDSNMKLSSVLSKVHRVSGTRIVDALLEGQTDPVYLASLCHGKVKADQEDIILALEGNLTDHHKFMIRIIRQDICQTEALIKELDVEIEKQLLPYAQEIALLSEIPGVGEQTAGELISEIGVDMEVFATDKHICSWAGISPGNNESAGKKKAEERPTETNK